MQSPPCAPQARSFACDWAELRSVTRNRLQGRVVPAVLQDAVDAIAAAAAAGGALGVGTDRYLGRMEERQLPAGVSLREVGCLCRCLACPPALQLFHGSFTPTAGFQRPRNQD